MSRIRELASKVSSRHVQQACAGLLALSLAFAGCQRDMADQPKYEPYETSSFFANGESSREPVEGTVARGQLQIDDHFFRGKVDGKLATTFPDELEERFGTATQADVAAGSADGLSRGAAKHLLLRGQERFNIFCAQCHSPTGDGQGMVVRRGFPRPPSYHIPRLREAPVGHFFDVITNGFGRMQAHGYLVPAEDRWAIVAYIRALQKSQHVELTKEEFEQLQKQHRE